jgi:tRNA uracil 4-sulfurtransferase
MARRGCRIDFLHFTASSAQQDEAEKDKIWRLAKILSRYTNGSRLWLVPYTNFDVALLGHDVPFDLVLFRRFMLRVAERLAKRIRANALVTGDNLSQVASQTITNLVSTDSATTMTVFRPVVGANKEEIIQWAHRIGTFEESIQPYKDCCALISHRPRTRSRNEDVEQLEKEIFKDYEALVTATLAQAVVIELPCTPAKPVTPVAANV